MEIPKHAIADLAPVASAAQHVRPACMPRVAPTGTEGDRGGGSTGNKDDNGWVDAHCGELVWAARAFPSYGEYVAGGALFGTVGQIIKQNIVKIR